MFPTVFPPQAYSASGAIKPAPRKPQKPQFGMPPAIGWGPDAPPQKIADAKKEIDPGGKGEEQKLLHGGSVYVTSDTLPLETFLAAGAAGDPNNHDQVRIVRASTSQHEDN
tara:strand:+ start:137 stop:469 length:333 start_codon:yes stop_codon:yes gene_type:complete